MYLIKFDHRFKFRESPSYKGLAFKVDKEKGRIEMKLDEERDIDLWEQVIANADRSHLEQWVQSF